MSKIPFKSQVKVRYGETDQMGVVYHGNYAQYFEIARIDWLNNLGVSYKSMEDNGVMLPVITLLTNFKRSAYFDDLLTITTTLKEIPSVKIIFEYEVHNQNGELLTTGETTLVFVNKKTKRPMKCPQYLLEKINAVL